MQRYVNRLPIIINTAPKVVAYRIIEWFSVICLRRQRPLSIFAEFASREDRSRISELLETVMRQMPAGVVIAEAPSGKIIPGNEEMEKIWQQPVISPASVEQYGEWKGFHPEDGRFYQAKEWPLARSILTLVKKPSGIKTIPEV